MTLYSRPIRVADIEHDPVALLDALVEAEPATGLWQDLFGALAKHVGRPATVVALLTAKTNGAELPALRTTAELQPGDVFLNFNGQLMLCLYNGLHGVVAEQRDNHMMTRLARSNKAFVTVTHHIDAPPFNDDLSERDQARRRHLDALIRRADRLALPEVEDSAAAPEE